MPKYTCIFSSFLDVEANSTLCKVMP